MNYFSKDVGTIAIVCLYLQSRYVIQDVINLSNIWYCITLSNSCSTDTIRQCFLTQFRCLHPSYHERLTLKCLDSISKYTPQSYIAEVTKTESKSTSGRTAPDRVEAEGTGTLVWWEGGTLRWRRILWIWSKLCDATGGGPPASLRAESNQVPTIIEI